MGSLFETTHNPDVLSCIANLSNDEVFTPPELVNQMLDMLPSELWSDPDATFLDPACKSGVFLREIAKRLIKGLEDEIPDLEERLEHIYRKQLYGIAITELTSLLSRRSLYCSKWPNSVYSIVQFDNPKGNIDYMKLEHSWEGGRCRFCGAAEREYKREEGLEQYAYEFIHLDNPEEVLPVKFDVIIGNPPYQMSGGGYGVSAMPIYHVFIDTAKKMMPRYLCMITPSRWFSGGRGLDSFRAEMLSDRRMKQIVDFENSADVFPGVDIAGGVSYFLWDRDYCGECAVTNKYIGGTDAVCKRPLDEYEIFIRSNKAISILKKVLSLHSGCYLSDRVLPSKPFGLRTFYEPVDRGVPCWFVQRKGLRFAKPEDVTDSWQVLDKWKVLIPAAPIAGQTDFSKPVGFYYPGNTRISKPGECCTESWLVAGAFETENEARSFLSYLFTKLARFMLLQAVISQHVTKKNFIFVPDLGDYSHEWTDTMLRKRWQIDDEEWEFINSKISCVTENGFSSGGESDE